MNADEFYEQRYPKRKTVSNIRAKGLMADYAAACATFREVGREIRVGTCDAHQFTPPLHTKTIACKNWQPLAQQALRLAQKYLPDSGGDGASYAYDMVTDALAVLAQPPASSGPFKCKDCGTTYSDDWSGTTCSVCDGDIFTDHGEFSRAEFEAWKQRALEAEEALAKRIFDVSSGPLGTCEQGDACNAYHDTPHKRDPSCINWRASSGWVDVRRDHCGHIYAVLRESGKLDYEIEITESQLAWFNALRKWLPSPPTPTEGL